MSNLPSLQQALEAKLDDLLKRPTERDAIHIERTADPLDAIQGVGDREIATLTLDAKARTLKSVQAALQRIKVGDYGVCLKCEEDINPKRLAAVPWAEHCIDCQERVDAEKRSSKVEEEVLRD
jgi:DnaK suppressor protein